LGLSYHHNGNHPNITRAAGGWDNVPYTWTAALATLIVLALSCRLTSFVVEPKVTISHHIGTTSRENTNTTSAILDRVVTAIFDRWVLAAAFVQLHADK
jgi:hypothetical protein